MSRGRGEGGYGAEFLRATASGLATLSDRIVSWQEQLERRAEEAEIKALADRELQTRKVEEARVASEKMWAERRAEELALAKLKEEGVGWGQRALVRVRKRLLSPLKEWKQRHDEHYNRFLVIQSQLAVDENNEPTPPWQAKAGAEDAWTQSLAELVNETKPFDWQEEAVDLAVGAEPVATSTAAQQAPQEADAIESEESILTSATDVTSAIQREEALVGAVEIMEQEAVLAAAEQIVADAEPSFPFPSPSSPASSAAVEAPVEPEAVEQEEPVAPEVAKVEAALEAAPASLPSDEAAVTEKAPVETEPVVEPVDEDESDVVETAVVEETVVDSIEEEEAITPVSVVEPSPVKEPVYTETEDNGNAIPAWAEGISWEEATNKPEEVAEVTTPAVEEEPKAKPVSQKKTPAKKTAKNKQTTKPAAKKTAAKPTTKKAAAKKTEKPVAKKAATTPAAEPKKTVKASTKKAAPAAKSESKSETKKTAEKEAVKPAAKKAPVKKTAKNKQTTKPAAKKKVAAKPAAKTPKNAAKPAVKKTAAKQTAKPATKKTAVKKPAASKASTNKGTSAAAAAGQSPIAVATQALISSGWTEADARKGGYVQHHWQQVKGAPKLEGDDLRKMTNCEEWVAKYIKELTTGTQTKPHYTRHMEESGSMVFKINNLVLARVDKDFKLHQLVTKAAAKLLI